MPTGENQPSNPSETNETIAMRALPATVSMPERYEQISELGRGGMGVVYKVRDRETGEVLALKFLKAEIAEDPQILERFKNELRLAHKITHRNVARLYEFHRVTGGAAYLSMEFVEGESLRAFLKNSGKLDSTQALDIARQMAAGLREAHRQSIAHRDLKPENVMLTAEGDVKVMDFGISRSFAAGATATGAIIGTPAYMSPEQAEGKPADHRSDIYTFGLMLYEMYTGVQAFTGETPFSVAIKQIRERPEPPRKLDPSVPKNVELTILRCLEKNPADRFQSIDEVIQALEGTPAAQPARAKAKVALRPWMAIAAAVVILAGAGLYYTWWRGQASDSFRVPIERFTLANGLEVVFSIDHSSPTVALSMCYKVGARNDPPGRNGLAHLVDHLAFQGSPNVARGEFISLIQGVGGVTDDNALADASLFWTQVPANQLELVLFLESDRMRALEFTPAGLEEARTTLNEERRTKVDNAAYGSAVVALTDAAYDNPVNKRFIFGSQQELASVTPEEALAFHQKYYGPSNAALALVGDFDPKNARERIRHYFEAVPPRPAPPKVDAHEPGRTAEVRRVVHDPAARAPILLIAWQVPPPSEHDWFVLMMLAQVLAANDAARLPSALVKGSGVASLITMEIGDSAPPDLMVAQVLALPGKDLTQVEALFHKEIERVAQAGVTQAELERAETDSLRLRAMGMIGSNARSIALARLLASHNRPNGINDWEDHARRVTPDELKRVAAKYLTPANRTVVVVIPDRGAQ